MLWLGENEVSVGQIVQKNKKKLEIFSFCYFFS